MPRSVRRRGQEPRVLVGAHLPGPEAELFDQICVAMDSDKAPIIRELVRGWIAEHREIVDPPNQGRLPIAS